MSASHESFEWHLTPAGGVEGSEFLDFGGNVLRPTPEDRVATFVLDEHQCHALEKIQCTWSQTWIKADSNLAPLYEKYGMHPAHVAQSLEKYGR
ncbi:hypothetical protein JM946_17325 [Steroidobacter sp. S1-65]|uniref:Uncharacterized protein n=1 Tax=Steroidobacter gossypii TaxID=2805490 RepID=A0ABS1WZT5_9GAMM|nr:hypothetical protein [Steroidobacter gossypii]MBM0106493.1 hypothetical protein [Steroidobacter gossypii]